LRSAWRTAETTASAGGHGMRNDDKTHGPGARGAGAVHNWLRRHAGCNVLAEVSHIELSHVRTVVFSGRQRQRSFHDRRRAPSLHSAVGQLFGRLLVVYHRQISRFSASRKLGDGRPPCDPFTRAACCRGPERQGARSARSRRCASRAPSRQPTPAAAGQSDCELPA
jgi:hypothetical protein